MWSPARGIFGSDLGQEMMEYLSGEGKRGLEIFWLEDLRILSLVLWSKR